MLGYRAIWQKLTVLYDKPNFRRNSPVADRTTSTINHFPDRKVHGAIMGLIWVLSAPDGPHVGPMNLDVSVVYGKLWRILWSQTGSCNFASVLRAEFLLGMSSYTHCLLYDFHSLITLSKYYSLVLTHRIRIIVKRVEVKCVSISNNSNNTKVNNDTSATQLIVIYTR